MAEIPRWQTPISRWQLDGNANDLYGLYNGTASNMTYSTDAKEKGLSGSFSLSPLGYISIAGHALSRYANFTFSMWFKCSSTGEMYLTHERVVSPDYVTGIIVTSNNTLRVLTYVNSTHYLVDSAVTIDRYVWNHIVVACIGSSTGSFYIYLNGNYYNSGSALRYPNNNAVESWIGCFLPTTLAKFNGLMDDVRFYDVALTADEVMNLYKSYATPIWQQPLHHWKLDGDATDSAGNKNGTAVGTVEYTKSSKVIGNYSLIGDGGVDYISIPFIRLYAYEKFSISAWFRYTGSGVVWLFTECKSSAADPRIMIDYDEAYDGLYYIVTNDVGSVPFLQSTGKLYGDGKWHHAVIVDDNGTVKGYVDGKITSINGSYTRPTITSNNNTISGKISSIPSYSTGGIADVRFYDVALSASDVRALYNSYFTEKATNFMSML